MDYTGTPRGKQLKQNSSRTGLASDNIRLFLRLLGFICIALGVASSAEAQSDLPLRYSIKTTVPFSEWDSGLPNFDPGNTAYIRNGGQLLSIAGDQVRVIDFKAAAAAAINRDIFKGRKTAWDELWDTSSFADTSIHFDKEGTAYTIVTPRYSNMGTAALLYSQDGCQTWTAVALSARAAILEKPFGGNHQNGPPTVLSLDRYGRYRTTNLWLELFQKADGVLTRRFPPQLVSNDSLLPISHSGVANSSLTIGSRVHIVYPRASAIQNGTGVYFRTFDLSKGAFIAEEQQIGESATSVAPDVHDVPAILASPQGRILVLVGGHHSKIRYILSEKYVETEAVRWKAQEDLNVDLPDGDKQAFTYLTAIYTDSDRLDIFARFEGKDYKFELVQIRAKINETTNEHSAAVVQKIAVPDRAFYGAWRHRIAIDRGRRIYIHFAYWPNQLTLDEAIALGVDGSTKRSCRADRCIYPSVSELAPTTLYSDDHADTWQKK